MKINELKITENNHYIKPNYQAWGRAGSCAASTLEGSLAVDVLEQIQAHYTGLGLNHFVIKHLELYQGENQKALSAYHLHNNSEGEFVAYLFEVDSFKLLGSTHLTKCNANLPLIAHEAAMNRALAFLNQYANDLVGEAVTVDFEMGIDPEKRIEFELKPQIGKVEFQWIGEHLETIETEGQEFVITGQKVKMFIPSLNLFAWVIVGGNGEVITFERNVCWDFPNQMRLTQMWLHPKWLDQA